MDITIYLPDDIGQRAKAQDVNLSRLLRDALAAQFAEEDAMAKLLEDPQEIKLQLENREGIIYTGRITGTQIAGNDHVEVFLTSRQNVVVYDIDHKKYYTEDQDGDLEDLVNDPDVYLEAMTALDRDAEIDLDV